MFTEGPITEDIRSEFLPEDVRVLFVGESPPANGTFFYKANSNLYDATKEAFRLAAPKLVRGSNFLDRFMALGCNLDDLCPKPVNHLKLDNPGAKQKRLQARVDGEEALAERMRSYEPRAIVIVMKGIAGNVRAAAEAAALGNVRWNELPFPGRKAHRESYVDELSTLLKQYRGSGFLRES